MKTNTPPSSPDPHLDGDREEVIDIGDIEEVIELDDDTNLEEVAERLVGAGGGEEDESMEDGEAADVTDMAAVVFSKHKGSVFSCSVSSSGNLAATGGEDDLAYVWDANTGNVVFTCTGHKDSVTWVDFSQDGSLLATGDMSGFIQVWKISTSSKIWEFEIGDLSWLTWHHASHVLLVGTADGEMWMWLIPQGNARTFPSYGVASQCGALLPDGKRSVAGYEDGSVRVFDLKTGQLVQHFKDGQANTASIASIAVHKDNTLILAGSFNGTAKLYNANSGKLVGTLNCEITPNSEEDNEADHTVEAVSFCPLTPNIAATATLAGYVTFWDISSQVSRHVIAQGCGSSRLVWHPSEPILFSAGLNGAIHSYDAQSGEPLAKYTGHKDSILALSVTKDGSALVTASDDGTARVFKFL
ncbi:angio-associated migratory cell protein-like isoform X2 [Homarus americanus]|nr:angio-associated migratory cell protein-like isoform X2 [Homarus americanus]